MRIFSLKEANDLIPTVTPLVELLIQNYREIQKAQLEFDAARVLRSSEAGGPPFSQKMGGLLMRKMSFLVPSGSIRVLSSVKNS